MNDTDWFVIVVGALAVVVFTGNELRRRREAPTRELVHAQPVMFATKAAVLIRARGGLEGNHWGVMKKGTGWPELVVHSGGLEVTIGAFDGMIGGNNTMLIEGATMRRDRLGVWPLVSGNRDSIRICGNDGTGGLREWKVSPRGTPIDEVWTQLVAAGVTPTT
jgi:hypothetical protein